MKLLREVTTCTHLPRPFPERTTIATDDSRLREQSSSAHCKHKHREIEALEDEFANLNNAAMLENGYSILVRLDEPVSSRVLLSSTFSLSLSLSLSTCDSNYAYDSRLGSTSEKDHHFPTSYSRTNVTMNGNDSSMLLHTIRFVLCNHVCTFFFIFVFHNRAFSSLYYRSWIQLQSSKI